VKSLLFYGNIRDFLVHFQLINSQILYLMGKSCKFSIGIKDEASMNGLTRD